MNPKKPTAGIILAAGLSSRFGKPKQLMDLNGKPLLAWAVDACLDSQLDKIMVILGDNASQIASDLLMKYADPRLITIINPQYKGGLSRSLQAGLVKMMSACPSVMFLLGDQPLVGSGLIDRLLACYWESEKDICVPVHRGRRGTPTLFSNRFYPHLLNLSGDIGARKIIQMHPESVLSVEVDDPLPFFDIDTETDLETLRTILEKPKK